jgi:glutaredoxin
VEYLDVRSDPALLREMLRHSGGRREVPVILIGDQVIIGHGGT